MRRAAILSFVAAAFASSVLFAEARGRDLFVVCQDDSAIVRIDVETRTVAARASLAGGPAMIAAGGGGKAFFVTHPDHGKITKLTAGLDVVATFAHEGTPFGVVADLAGRFIYVSDWKKNVVVRRDARTGEALGAAEVGREPAGLVLERAGARIYVANRESRSVSVVDALSMRSIAEIPVGEGPFALALGAREKRLFVANVRSRDVTVIDAEKLAVVATIPIGGAPYGAALDSSGEILISNQHGDSISVIDPATLIVSRVIRVGRFPEGLAADSGVAYVANWFSGDVSVVELSRAAQVALVKVCEGPRSMTFGGDGS